MAWLLLRLLSPGLLQALNLGLCLRLFGRKFRVSSS